MTTLVMLMIRDFEISLWIQSAPVQSDAPSVESWKHSLPESMPLPFYFPPPLPPNIKCGTYTGITELISETKKANVV